MTSWRPPDRLRPHALALGFVLVMLLPLLGRPAVVSADEGAVLATVDLRAEQGSWSMVDPLHRVDPEGRWFGFEFSDRSGDRYFPYAKHAAYPAVVTPVYRVAGPLGVVAVSTFGTWAAAVLAALVARRLRRPLAIPTLWVVGLASPLFFDGYWVIAHSIGAAGATLAVWASIGVLDATTTRRRVAWGAAVAVATLGTTLLRSEGMLFGVALGAALVGVAVRRRRPAVGAIGALTGAVAVAGWRLDGMIASSIIGSAKAPFSIDRDPGSSWLAGRVDGLWSSVLRPQLQAPTAAGSILMTVALVGVLGAAYARWKPGETRIVVGAAVVAAVLAAARLVLPLAPVPGLLVAVPVLTVGLVLLDRTSVRDDASAMIVGAAALFAAAVLATQYEVGGSMEWGGRFFHLALPSLVPVLLAALVDTGKRLDVPARRVAGGALVVVSLVLTITAVGSILRLRSGTERLAAAVEQARRSTPSGEDGVVVTNMAGLARFVWSDAVDGRYLAVERPADLAEVGRRLSAAGKDDVVFAAAVRRDRDPQRLEGYREVARMTVGDWDLVMMRRRTDTPPG